MEKISVIIPVYNKRNYIIKCIESVRSQTYQNLQIIVIDDGSTDDSSQIVKEKFLEDERVLFIQQSNKGHSETRNVGIRHSVGELIFFLDADDFLPNNFVFQTMYNNMKLNSSDIVIGEIVSNNNSVRHLTYNRINVDFSASGYDVLKELIRKNQYYAVMCSKLYKNNLIKNNNLFFKKLIHDDEEWSPKIFYYAEKVSFTNHECYERVILDNSVTRIVSEKNFLTKAIDKIKVCLSLDDFFKDAGSQEISKLIFSFYLAAICSFNEKLLSKDSFEKINIQILSSKNLIKHSRISYRYEHNLLFIIYKLFGFSVFKKIVLKIKK